MSKLRMRLKLAEQEYTIDQNTGYYIFNDGTVIDPDTGEIIENTQLNTPENTMNTWKNDMKNILFEEKQQAYKDYPGQNYKNQWGVVSPLNVLFVDKVNEMYSMDVESAKQMIIQTIEDMNNKYGHNDDSYDYVSQDYLNKMKINLNKFKTIDQVVTYLTNAYFKGMGMGMTKQKWARLKQAANSNNNLEDFIGRKFVFDVKEWGADFVDCDIDGQEGIILALDFQVNDFEKNYWNVKLDDGTILKDVSGYHLTLI